MGRNKYIDYLKAVAIIFVIITHNEIDFQTRINILTPLWISMAVPIFMVISGMNFSASVSRSQISSIRGWYTVKNLVPRFKRILIPYLLVVVAEVLYLIIRRGASISFGSFMEHLVVGGYGPGSYYTPILIQFFIIFPLCYFAMKNDKIVGGMFIIALNIIFELIIHYYNIDTEIYRLLIFRYLAYIVFGVYIFQSIKENKAISKPFLVISFCIGLLYLLITRYLGYKPTLLTYWSNTAFPAAFYVFPIIYMVIRLKQSDRVSLLGKYFALIGKASYHIFLIQMAYFYFGADGKFPTPYTIIVSVVLCVNIGILFYLAETKWIRLLFRKRKPQVISSSNSDELSA